MAEQDTAQEIIYGRCPTAIGAYQDLLVVREGKSKWGVVGCPKRGEYGFFPADDVAEVIANDSVETTVITPSTPEARTAVSGLIRTLNTLTEGSMIPHGLVPATLKKIVSI